MSTTTSSGKSSSSAAIVEQHEHERHSTQQNYEQQHQTVHDERRPRTPQDPHHHPSRNKMPIVKDIDEKDETNTATATATLLSSTTINDTSAVTATTKPFVPEYHHPYMSSTSDSSPDRRQLQKPYHNNSNNNNNNTLSLRQRRNVFQNHPTLNGTIINSLNTNNTNVSNNNLSTTTESSTAAAAASSSSSAAARIKDHRHRQDEEYYYGDANSPRYYFMSEPSQSEDVDASSSFYTNTASSRSFGSPLRSTRSQQPQQQQQQEHPYPFHPHHYPQQQQLLNPRYTIYNFSGEKVDAAIHNNNPNLIVPNHPDDDDDDPTNVVGNDINIQMKKSASNTSLSSLGSPGASYAFKEKSTTNHLFSNQNISKRRQLYFPSFSNTTTNNTNTDDNNHARSGSTHEISTNTKSTSKLGVQNANVPVLNEETSKKISSFPTPSFSSLSSSPTKSSTTNHRRRVIPSPRAEPEYIDDDAVDNKNTKNNNDESVGVVGGEDMSMNIENDEHLSLSDYGEEARSDDDDKEEKFIVESMNVVDNIPTKQQDGNISSNCKKNEDKVSDDDGISYDTASTAASQQKEEEEKEDTNTTIRTKNTSSSQRSQYVAKKEEFYEIDSPPNIEKNIKYSESPFRSTTNDYANNMMKEEDNVGDDTITPKRRTTRILGKPSVGTGDIDVKMNNVVQQHQQQHGQERKRVNSEGKRATKHRRKKSGDDVAATLLTGSPAWAGMELHNLPLPSQNEDDDDDDIFKDNILGGVAGGGSMTSPIRESLSFGAVNSEGRSHHRRSKRRTASETSLLHMNQIMGGRNDSWSNNPNSNHMKHVPLEQTQHRHQYQYPQDVMQVAEFSKYALGDVEVGMPTSKSFNDDSIAKGKSDGTQHDLNTKTAASLPNANEILDNISVGSVGSHGTSTSAFSWISNKISLFSKNDDLRSSGGLDHMLDSTASLKEPQTLQYSSPIPEEVTSSGSPLDPKQRFQPGMYDEGVMSMSMNPTANEDFPLQPLLNDEDPQAERRQKEYFSVGNVPTTFENPITFMVIYFVFYIILALVIFGLEVRWVSSCVNF